MLVPYTGVLIALSERGEASLRMLCNGSSARAYSRVDKAVLLQDLVRPWLYPKSRTRVCPCRNEHKTQSGELARGKSTANLYQTTFHYKQRSVLRWHA